MGLPMYSSTLIPMPITPLSEVWLFDQSLSLDVFGEVFGEAYWWLIWQAADF